MSFIPAAEFRHVLGHLPTGVVIVTSELEGNPVGMAVNSLTSVSLDPPLLLFCPARSSETWPQIREAGSFCVNVMGGHQEEVSRRFASRDGDRFAGLELVSRGGNPALPEAIAWIECSLSTEFEAGDHTIALGQVEALEACMDAVPLIFFKGRYGTFIGAS